jgi:hypothetical protein
MGKTNKKINIRKTSRIFDIRKIHDKLHSDHFTEDKDYSCHTDDETNFMFDISTDDEDTLTDNTNEEMERLVRLQSDEDNVYCNLSEGEQTDDELSSLSSETIDPIDCDEDYSLPYDVFNLRFDVSQFSKPINIEPSKSDYEIRSMLFDEIRCLPDFNVLKLKYALLEDIRVYDRSKLKPANRSHWIRYFKSFFY